MRLTIITINYNNKEGLRQTIDSVISQTKTPYEYIIIDGASSDGSQLLLSEYSSFITRSVSEKDTGIYNAMNKGIIISTGDYLLFLNSGDTLIDVNVLERISSELMDADILEGDTACFLYGKFNHTWMAPDSITVNTFYSGSIAHQSALIRRTLFDNELYDENLKIVSDWKFFFKKLIFCNATYRKVGFTISCFDMSGMSNRPEHEIKHQCELRKVKEELMPDIWRKDYDEYIENRTEIERWCQENRKFWFVRLASIIVVWSEKVFRKIGLY